jgi:hypothetical protein
MWPKQGRPRARNNLKKLSKAPSLLNGIKLGKQEGEMRKPPLAHEWPGDIDGSRAYLFNQDAEFCRRMLIAIESGLETCPIGVSTAPCTTNPVLADSWKQPPMPF